jgi:mannosyltransferase OCH1-like enzyme
MLEQLYINERKNPYEIGNILGCNHKTVRAYLRKHNIQLRTAQEYNYLPKRTHTSPTTEQLNSKLSIMAHIMYICEGWHTEKTDMLNFVNQDTALIDIFIKCLEQIYNYKTITVEISFNNNDKSSLDKVRIYEEIYSNRKTRRSNDPTRKNPILRVKAGGKNLAREFIDNAYKLLSI